MRRSCLVGWLASLLLIIGCESDAPAANPATQSTPTLSPAFQPAAITPYPTPTRLPTAVPPVAPTQTPAPGEAPAPQAASGTVTEVVVYNENVNPNWGLVNSDGMNYKVRDSTHAYSSTYGLRVTPTKDFGALFFTVNPNSKEVYTRSQAFEVDLWLYSGTSRITQDDLTVTVVGSNAQPYWVADDKSVTITDKQFFSESRLRYLGIDHTIPPDTWVPLRVELDKLPYEPDYQYITGIYIKNDAGFRQMFHIDQLKILMVK